ncbi:hypothetical protein JXA32_12095 [Candidatus Sumerlaeota bacterium]|nr:hypothetical protein [Candidatus Sumerlaeota bacterium]
MTKNNKCILPIQSLSMLLLAAILLFSVADVQAQDVNPPFINLYTNTLTDLDEILYGIIFFDDVTGTFDETDVTTTGTLSGNASVTVTPTTDWQLYYVKVELLDPDANGTIGIVTGTDIYNTSGTQISGSSESTIIEIDNTMSSVEEFINSSFEQTPTASGRPFGWDGTVINVGSPWQMSEMHTITHVYDPVNALNGSTYVNVECTSPTLDYGVALVQNIEKNKWKPNRDYRLYIRFRCHNGATLGVGREYYGNTTPINVGLGVASLEYYYTDVMSYPLPWGAADAGEWIEGAYTFTELTPGTWNREDKIVIWAGGLNLGGSVDIDNMMLVETAYHGASVSLQAEESSVDYDYGDGLEILFFQNEIAQYHTAMWYDEEPPGFNWPNLNQYWDISDPDGAFSAEVRLHYTDDSLTSAGLNSSELAIYQYAGGDWHELASGIEVSENYVYTIAPTSSFSLWTLGLTGRPVITTRSKTEDWPSYH